MARPSSVLVKVSASAPAASAASATASEIGGVRRELGPSGPPTGRRRRHGRPGGLGRVGEHAAAVLEVRAADVHLDGQHARRSGRQKRRGPLVVLDPASPMLTTTRAPDGLEGGQLVDEPRRDAGALQADRVQHAPRHRAQARAGVPGHGSADNDLRRRRRWPRGRSRRRARHRGRQCPKLSSPRSATARSRPRSKDRPRRHRCGSSRQRARSLVHRSRGAVSDDDLAGEHRVTDLAGEPESS